MSIKRIIEASTRAILFEKTNPDSDPVAVVDFILFDSERNVVYDSNGEFDMFYISDESYSTNQYRIRLRRDNFKKGEVNNITGVISFPQSAKEEDVDVIKINPKWVYKFFVEDISDTVLSDIVSKTSDYVGVEEDFEFKINIKINKVLDKTFISQDDMTSFAKDKAGVDKTIDQADDYLSKFGMGTKTRKKSSKDNDDDDSGNTMKGTLYNMKIILKGKDVEDYEIFNKPLAFKHNMAKQIGTLTGKNIQLSDDRKDKFDDVRIMFDSDDDRLTRGSNYKIKTIYSNFDGERFSKKFDKYDTLVVVDFDKK